MNLLEHYIKDILSVEEYSAEWTKEFPERSFVKVKITYECYGRVETGIHVWNTDQWESIQQKGYFMG